MAEKIPNEVMEECKEAFSLFDTKEEGTITTKEMIQIIGYLGQKPTEDEVQEILADIDPSGFGKVEWTEFLSLCHKRM